MTFLPSKFFSILQDISLKLDLKTISSLGVVVLLLLLLPVGTFLLKDPLNFFSRAAVIINPCDMASSNPIICENSKTGNDPAEWKVSGAGGIPGHDDRIGGFAADISYNKGAQALFKIKSSTPQYKIDIYRVGYYGGKGARKIISVPQTGSSTQPECNVDQTTNIVDCGNWSQSASWQIPSDAVSGVYFAKLTQINPSDPNPGAAHIYFIVRDDSSNSDILFQTSDTTWHAYNLSPSSLAPSKLTRNPSGSFYQGNIATKVSYNRPFYQYYIDNPPTNNLFFHFEYSAIRFLEKNGFNVSYFTNVDADRDGDLIKNHKLFISAGHDEYWSGNQRKKVEEARDAGVNLAFFSGNSVYWKVRWEDNNRTLVCYKESQGNAKIDPSPEWTGTWRDPRNSPPSDGGRPENELIGNIFTVNGWRDYDSVQVPYEDSRMRFWRNTSVANIQPGEKVTFAPGTLGFEWHEDLDNGFRPKGTIRLSTATYDIQDNKLLKPGPNYGGQTTDYGNGMATHHLTLYKAPSGAYVFSAGSIQWPWALDTDAAKVSQATFSEDQRIKQATINLFADMGVQPGNLEAGLSIAQKTTDTQAPVSQINPQTKKMYQNGYGVVYGTASDSGGGVVGGIEVSVDNGLTWHPATSGRDKWSYRFSTGTQGKITIQSRATDDSGNTQGTINSVEYTLSAPFTGAVKNDFDGDGNADFALWQPATGKWLIKDVADHGIDFVKGDVQVPADYNGDKITDIAVYKKQGGLWYIKGINEAGIQWGTEKHIPVPADYNGDGKDDIAVFSPADGMWYIKDGEYGAQWGLVGDIPVPADYNGDGKADLAVWRPSNGMWYIRNIAPSGIKLGNFGDVPVPADYNGQSKSIPAVFRPSNNTWYFSNGPSIQYGVSGYTNMPIPLDYNNDGKADPALWQQQNSTFIVKDQITGLQFGSQTDLPLPITGFGGRFSQIFPLPLFALTQQDMNKNGKADFGVFERFSGYWYVMENGPNQVKLPGAPISDKNISVSGDYNSDGKTDMALFNPDSATWYIEGQSAGIKWGIPGDIPVQGDYDGDGTLDIAVWRSSDGTWYIRNVAPNGIKLGSNGDIPVPGDYNGDNKTDPAVWRKTGGMWYIKDVAPNGIQWGIATDIPTPADYDGDGKTEIAVWRPSNGNWYVRGIAPNGIQWGANGHIPVPADYNGDGKAEYAVWAQDGGYWYVRFEPYGLQWGGNGHTPTTKRPSFSGAYPY